MNFIFSGIFWLKKIELCRGSYFLRQKHGHLVKIHAATRHYIVSHLPAKSVRFCQTWGIPRVVKKQEVRVVVDENYTVPKATHVSEKCLGVYMGASPLASKFPKAVQPSSFRKFLKAFNPPPFGNFREIQGSNKT